MCSTLEYASIRLKSGVPSKNSAATSIENNPIASSVRAVTSLWPAASTTCRTRRCVEVQQRHGGESGGFDRDPEQRQMLRLQRYAHQPKQSEQHRDEHAI